MYVQSLLNIDTSKCEYLFLSEFIREYIVPSPSKL